MNLYPSYVIPLFISFVILVMFFAAISIMRTERSLGNKTPWLIMTIFLSIFGSVAYGLNLLISKNRIPKP